MPWFFAFTAPALGQGFRFGVKAGVPLTTYFAQSEKTSVSGVTIDSSFEVEGHSFDAPLGVDLVVVLE
jgi:hypothetical protein